MKFQLIPDAASSFAEQVEPLWWFLVAVTLVMTFLAIPFAVTTGRRGALYGIGLAATSVSWAEAGLPEIVCQCRELHRLAIEGRAP